MSIFFCFFAEKLFIALIANRHGLNCAKPRTLAPIIMPAILVIRMFLSADVRTVCDRKTRKGLFGEIPFLGGNGWNLCHAAWSDMPLGSLGGRLGAF